jgi:hypothetical protein
MTCLLVRPLVPSRLESPTRGIFAFVAHRLVIMALSNGWRFVGDLGPVHGQWSLLMWWCCGDCKDREPPKIN